MREVTLRVRHHGEPESDVSANYPNVTIRSVSSLTGSAQQRKRIVELRGPEADVAGFLEEFGAAESVVEVEPYSPLSADRVLVGATYDSYTWDSIAQRVADLGVHYRVGTVIRAGWEHWTFYLEAEDDLDALVDSLESAGNTVELVRNVSFGDPENPDPLALSSMLEDLTERQQEVLATAIGLGYYDRAADTAIEDVAAEHDVATSTTWEHLVAAEETVMAELGEFLRSRGR